MNDADNPHPLLQYERRIVQRTSDVQTSISIDVGRANVPSNPDLFGDDGTNFNEPETTYKSQYPYNHVYESEAGHIKEFDDTPNSERIHERHSTGTGYEINEFGDKVQRVKRDNYEIITNDHFAHIKGTHNIQLTAVFESL